MEEKVQKQASNTCGMFEWKLEGLEDGYRVTIKGDKEKIKEKRRVGASFINFLRQSDKAGLPIPFFFRWMLRFWESYK